MDALLNRSGRDCWHQMLSGALTALSAFQLLLLLCALSGGASELIALVVSGHDGQQWQTLKKAPLYYE
jgi:hypothetical protein